MVHRKGKVEKGRSQSPGTLRVRTETSGLSLKLRKISYKEDF
jgi:hypothetical protein